MSENMRVTVRINEVCTKEEAYADASLTFAMAKESPMTSVVAWSPSSVTKTMGALFGVYYIIPSSGRKPGHIITVFYKLKCDEKSEPKESEVLTYDYEVTDSKLEGNDSFDN